MLEPNIASRYSTLDMIAETDCNGSAVYDTLPSNVVIVLGIECVFKFISDAITEEDAEGGFKHRFAILWKASLHQSTQLLHSRCAPFQRSALHLLYEGGIPFLFPCHLGRHKRNGFIFPLSDDFSFLFIHVQSIVSY